MTLDGFESRDMAANGTRIFVCCAGSGPPVLLLHGFPETLLMWRHVAPRLARSFTVVCADLRGYGRSGCPPSDSDHASYSKRVMARDMVEVMHGLGFGQFAVVGHDRGGRVAYRLALDHQDRVRHVAVLDVLPNETVWERADEKFALAFWPWTLLAQPAPFPERVLMSTADSIVDHALEAWGSPAAVFPADVRAAYAAPLRDPEHARAVCEEYRAAATIDREHDRADLAARRRITSPLLVLWNARGPLGSWYESEGGPVGLWQQWSTQVSGRSLAAGHFFPEEVPDETATALEHFLGARGH